MSDAVPKMSRRLVLFPWKTFRRFEFTAQFMPSDRLLQELEYSSSAKTVTSNQHRNSGQRQRSVQSLPEQMFSLTGIRNAPLETIGASRAGRGDNAGRDAILDQAPARDTMSPRRDFYLSSGGG
jgi:hypothetical protein